MFKRNPISTPSRNLFILVTILLLLNFPIGGLFAVIGYSEAGEIVYEQKHNSRTHLTAEIVQLHENDEYRRAVTLRRTSNPLKFISREQIFSVHKCDESMQVDWLSGALRIRCRNPAGIAMQRNKVYGVPVVYEF
jgi:hypothetical protein